MSSPIPRAILAILLLVLPAARAGAQETCGKLHESQDCGPAEYEAALARQKTAPTVTLPAPEQPAPADSAQSNANLRQRALDLYRARAVAMGNSVQCCHPGADGTLWCH